MFSGKRLFLHTKEQVVLALRLVILVSMAIMTCWGQRLIAVPLPVYLALLIFLINTLLAYLEYFHLLDSFKTLALGFIVDLVAMTLLVYYSGGPEVHRFYLVFLITILITATTHTLVAAFITSFIASVIYGLITVQGEMRGVESLLSFMFLSRIAFLFTIATFIGYLAEETERERQEKEVVKAELVKKERLALVGQLASGLAHDFFNILGGLKKLIEFSFQQKDSPEEQRKVMKLTESGLDRALTIVRNLLTFARKPIPQLTLTRVDKIIEEVLALIGNDFEKDNIKITKEINPTPEIKADSTQLHQVLLNLMINARQAMTSQSGKIHISLRPVEKYIELEVSDTGHGIAPEIKEKVFEPFFSSKTTPKKGSGGIGLGLYVSLEIIKAHNGSIDIESKPGQGTKVSVKLPIKG